MRICAPVLSATGTPRSVTRNALETMGSSVYVIRRVVTRARRGESVVATPVRRYQPGRDATRTMPAPRDRRRRSPWAGRGRCGCIARWNTSRPRWDGSSVPVLAIRGPIVNRQFPAPLSITLHVKVMLSGPSRPVSLGSAQKLLHRLAAANRRDTASPRSPLPPVATRLGDTVSLGFRSPSGPAVNFARTFSRRGGRFD